MVGVCFLACLCVPGRLQAADQSKFRPPRRIAIAPLKNLRPNTDTDWIGAGAAETITTKLAGVPDLLAVERAQILKIIEEQNFQKADFADAKMAVKIGKLVGAERILVGTYAKSGKNMLFNVRVVDVETGVVLNTASLQEAEDKIFDALFQLADAVIQSFDKKVVIVRNRPTLAGTPKEERIELTDAQLKRLKKWGTANAEAHEAYSRGCAAKDLGEQIRWYTKSITLDAKYASPYTNRGMVYYEKGDHAAAIKGPSI